MSFEKKFKFASIYNKGSDLALPTAVFFENKHYLAYLFSKICFLSIEKSVSDGSGVRP